MNISKIDKNDIYANRLELWFDYFSPTDAIWRCFSGFDIDKWQNQVLVVHCIECYFVESWKIKTMAHVNLTDKDRSFAAAAGSKSTEKRNSMTVKTTLEFILLFWLVSGTPFSTPPPTPSRRSSSGAGETIKNETATLPRSAIYIIFVEGCERFCFYGLKTILLLYLMHFLLIDKDSATAGYHLFAFGCYFTPTIGAILSDGFIGRYWTILFLSVFYFIGTLVLTLTAIPSIGGRQLFVDFCLKIIFSRRKTFFCLNFLLELVPSSVYYSLLLALVE